MSFDNNPQRLNIYCFFFVMNASICLGGFFCFFFSTNRLHFQPVQDKKLGIFNGNAQMRPVEDDVDGRAKSCLILRTVGRAIAPSSKSRACPRRSKTKSTTDLDRSDEKAFILAFQYFPRLPLDPLLSHCGHQMVLIYDLSFFPDSKYGGG